MHGYVALSKGGGLRVDRLQAVGGTGSSCGAAVVNAVIGLYASVDGRGGAGGPELASSHGTWARHAVARVARPAGLVHKPLLRLRRENGSASCRERVASPL